MDLKPNSDEIILHITKVRARNNGLWMAILETAICYAPDVTREIIKDIRKNDQEVAAWLGKL